MKNNLQENTFFIPPEIKSTTIASISIEKLQIKKVGKSEKKTMDISKDILKEIEVTAIDVVRQGRRGDISFDPEKNTLASRSNTTKISMA